MADYDLAVIGSGSAGITAARLAAKLDLAVALVERDRVGGDCLWTGCVPSKALVASARAAHTMRTADRLGLERVDPEIDLGTVWKRMHGIQDEIAAADDNAHILGELGIDVIFGDARMITPREISVGTRTITARFTLIATGSRPAAPPINGLRELGYSTTESFFESPPPGRLAILGGGPIGCELAQACNRLGITGTLLEREPTLLPGEEPELVEMLTRTLETEGVHVETSVDISAAREDGSSKILVDADEREWSADELLVATSRRPNIEGLGLDDIGVDTTPAGVRVDSRLRSTVANLYAAGDVAGQHRFTHTAGAEAAAAVRNMFFPGSVRDIGPVPSTVFTDPELARVGPTIAEAERLHGAALEIHRFDFADVDRARADGETTGRLVVLTKRRQRIVGAHILAAHAGELITEFTNAIAARQSIIDIGSVLHAYPTFSMAAGMLGAEALFDKAARYGWLARRRR